METLFLTIKEIGQMTGRSERTVHRWLRRHGLGGDHRRSIALADLKSKWPAFYNTYMLGNERPPCPECGAPVVCECSVCRFSLP